MALTDADPIPLKNTAFRVTFYIIDADGDPVASATINSGLASGSGKALVSKDGAASVNSTNSVTEIDNGWYYLDLSATEMNADTVAVMVRTTTSGAKNTPIVLYPASTVDAVVVTGSVAGFISGLRARGIQTADLSDADLTTIIGEALYEFSRFRPILSDRTFLTVADQQLYTWSAIGDSSGLQAVLVVWNPYQTGDEWNLARTLATLGVPREAGYWHMPSQDIIEQAKSSAWASSYGGTGYQIDIVGGDVYLNPTPELADETVYVLYTKMHTAVATIPSSDRDIFLDLLESACSERIANEVAEISAKSRIRTPEYEVETAAQIQRWDTRSKRMRERFISKCQAGRAVVARS